jgi:hypothetical protein
MEVSDISPAVASVHSKIVTIRVDLAVVGSDLPSIGTQFSL